MLPQDKWDKMKGCIVWIWEMFESNPDQMDRSELESICGFLIYSARTYPILNVYYKGLHLTMDSWRPHWDKVGWKL